MTKNHQMSARSQLSRSRMDSHLFRTWEHSDNAGISDTTAAQGRAKAVVVCGDSSAIRLFRPTIAVGCRGAGGFLKLRFPDHNNLPVISWKPEDSTPRKFAGHINGQQRESVAPRDYGGSISGGTGCTHQQIMQLVGGEDEGPITDPSGRILVRKAPHALLLY